MPRPDRPCAVCATPAAKYNCPKCRAAYCCIACWKPGNDFALSHHDEARPKRAAREPGRPAYTKDDSDCPKADAGDVLSRMCELRLGREELRREPSLTLSGHDRGG